MAINEKTDVTITEYRRSQRPVVQNDFVKYMMTELQRVESSLSTITSSSIQVADREPDNPQRGMVRFNVTPWDPLGDASEGLVVYNGTGWVAV